MHDRLRDGFDELLLLAPHDPEPEGAEPLRWRGTYLAEARLRALAADWMNLQTLRRLAAREGTGFSLATSSNEEVVRQVAQLLEAGRLRVARVAPRRFTGMLLGRPEERSALPASPPETSLSLELLVLDVVSGEPVPDIAFRVELPDGGERQVRTDRAGSVSLRGLGRESVRVVSVLPPDASIDTTLTLDDASGPGARPAPAGACALARVLTHRVADGETLDGIAERYGLSRDALTRFNWETADPQEVERYLFHAVGSTRKDAGGKRVLSGRDRPGVLYVPRPVELGRVALGRTHVLRARAVLPTPPVRFST